MNVKRSVNEDGVVQGLITEISANPSLVTHVMEEGLYQVAHWNGWDVETKAEFSLSLPLFVCCKGAQKKQELRIASQQALSGSFQSALSTSLQ